ncbi:MAG: hypothetical protein ACRD44_06380 [Bryobacteraceae bacterium]
MRCLLGILMIGALQAQTVNYTYDEAGRLIRVAYPNGKTISYSYDPAGNLLRRLVFSAVAGAAPVAGAAGVVNAASFLGGPVAAGEIVTLFGAGIGPANLVGATLTRFGFVDTLAGETSVLFDGIPAPVIYSSTGQTSVIVPYAVAAKANTQMVVEYQGRRSAPVAIPVAAAVPALFWANSSVKGNGAILNEDTSFNSADNPAAKGSVVVLYGTGEGQTNPPGIDGRIAAAVFPKPLTPITVRIGGIDAEVLYFGAAPGLVAGVFQVNARVPAEAPSGDVPVVVSVGSAASQPELTVAVQ